MSGTAVLLLLILQSPEPQLQVTVRCKLDTQLPLEEISVSVEEKRELRATPESHPSGGAAVTLNDLPEGDLHLMFYRRDVLLGRVKVGSAEKGQFIRLTVRLVEGNAIAVDEFRIRGVSDGAPEPKPPVPEPVSEPRPREALAPPAPAERPTAQSPPHCPPPGEPLTLTGRLARTIDNDSFTLESGPWSYTVYIGSATRILRGATSAGTVDLLEGQTLTVKGTVAAGPEGECSVGAKEIRLRP